MDLMLLAQWEAETATTTTSTAEGAAIATTTLVCMGIFGLIFYVLIAWSQMKIAQRAGTTHPRWAWVPVLNAAQIFDLAGYPAWYAALTLIPIVNLYALVMFYVAWYKILVEKLGKDVLHFVLFIVFNVWYMLYLAFIDKGEAVKQEE